jgi:hypothetical protein
MLSSMLVLSCYDLEYMAVSVIGFAPNQNDVRRQSTGWPLKISLLNAIVILVVMPAGKPVSDLDVDENGWPILQKVLAALI